MWCVETQKNVQKKASRIETREIVLYTPAGKKTLSARSPEIRIAPRPRPMCPGGRPVSDHFVFRRKVPCTKRKVGKSAKTDKHTYTYRRVDGKEAGAGGRRAGRGEGKRGKGVLGYCEGGADGWPSGNGLDGSCCWAWQESAYLEKSHPHEVICCMLER